MATSRASIRYAKSLFTLAEKQGSLEQMEGDVQTVQAAIAGSDELDLMLNSPVIKPDAKERILRLIFAESIGELSMSFLSILVRKGRESLLPTIMEEASGLIRAMRNVKVAEVRTAVPMNDAIRERVTAALKKMHEGEVELNEQVDASLIGGFQLFMDNRMIDASIKREIDLLRRHINDHDYEPEF
jgi:F-type H+-transporting ATPase subunit delta